jgi:predicted TIM-barrel fold metal-dependent hydrolase
VTPGLKQAGAFLLFLVICGCAAVALGADTAPRYYARGDFQRVEKIDAHVHVHGTADRFMAQALHDNFRILTINVDDADYPPIGEQQQAARSLQKRYPGWVAFAATFSVEGFQAPGWGTATREQIEAALAEGAVGVKMWKNLGMELRDPDGSYVMPDDARLEPIIAALERDHVVLLGHQAEPLNCWLPFAKMTVRSDRDYFREHPQYYRYQHPQMPSHDAILAARDRLLSAHPALRFDAVHLASLEWDVDRVAAFLDRFPNASVDLAARMAHLQYQAAANRDKVRAFLLRYQDRVLYGSDVAYGPGDSDAGAVNEVHSGWLEDWRFLVTADVMHSNEFSASFRGLRLPREVIDKLYRRNAQALFSKGWNPAASTGTALAVATPTS